MYQQMWVKYCLMFILCFVTGWTTAVRAMQQGAMLTEHVSEQAMNVMPSLSCQHGHKNNHQLSAEHHHQASQFNAQQVLKPQHIPMDECVHHEAQSLDQTHNPLIHQHMQDCQDCVGWYCLTNLALAPDELTAFKVIKFNLRIQLYNNYDAQWSAGYLSDVLRPPQFLI